MVEAGYPAERSTGFLRGCHHCDGSHGRQSCDKWRNECNRVHLDFLGHCGDVHGDGFCVGLDRKGEGCLQAVVSHFMCQMISNCRGFGSYISSRRALKSHGAYLFTALSI